MNAACKIKRIHDILRDFWLFQLLQITEQEASFAEMFVLSLIFWLAAGFAMIRWIVALINLVSWPVLPAGKGSSQPLISILVPARNEEKTLPLLRQQLQALTYPALEILILNDQSEDHTEEILEEWASEDERVRVLNGTSLPKGWLGKPWACHQLASEAKGDYFLYLDADIAFVSDQLADALIKEMEVRPTALISAFPGQIMKTVGERIVVPNLHELLLSMLPMFLIRRSPLTALSAANGQCMFFDAQLYRKYQWHQLVRGEIIEDIAIMKTIKRHGQRGNTLIASQLIKCRMYDSLKAGIDGFSKNMLSGFGGSVTGLMVYLGFISLGWGVAVFTIAIHWYVVAMILIISRRIMTSIVAGQSILPNLLLHPAQIAVMVYIGARSVIHTYSGTLTWKGRKVAQR